jgi:SAM-dependent methyltransferase
MPAKGVEAYPKEYYGGPTAKFSGWAQYLRRRFHRSRARWVRKWASRKDGYIYDVGCGDGLFLESASQLGFRPMGFEPEGLPRVQAEKRMKKKVDRKLFQSVGAKKLAAITCWQVIEHLNNPIPFLRACRRHLKPGGLLAFSTVNLDSYQSKCFGGNWLHLDPPRHLWVGTLRGLVKLVQDSGFTVMKIRYNCLEFGPIGWVDSLFNGMDRKRDRLLECLKQGCREPHDWLIWFLAAALTPLAFALSLLEAGLNHPATFEIYARREKRGARRQGG